ncbi:sigma-70 family RNA polymerase sigma factor [Streptomyces albogriseolus]
MEGVARLAGLDARETTELVAGARVRPDTDGVVKGDSGLSQPSGVSGAPSPEEVPAAVVAKAPGPAHGATDTADGDLAGAVAAALAVLEADRFERRPGKRLLTAEAEVGLAVLLRGGADRVAREPDEEELKALPGDDLRIRARDCLVVHNQGLVHSLARTVPEQGLEYEDLFQHGVLGLMRATRKFDPTMGNKFSTYATWWIRQSMTRAIADEGAVIRVPVHMHEQMRKVARAERALANEGRRATDVDVAVRCDLTLQKVQEIRRLTRRTDSLDRVIGDGATLADFVGRTHVLPSVEKQVLDALHVEAALAVVDTFPERERRILVRRLGLDGDDPSTLDEIGCEFGVTRERIRQIEGKTRPVFQERLREAGLTGAGLDALCGKAERAAERAAEAVRQARIARATHAARTARARLALRRAKAERAARAAGTEPQVTVAPAPTEAAQAGEGTPVAEAPVVAGTSKAGEPVRAGGDARTETKAETETAPGAEGGRDADRAAAEESADLERAVDVEAVPDATVEEAEPSEAAAAEEVAPPPAAPEGDATAAGTAQAPVAAEAAEPPREERPVRTEAREAGVAVRPQFTAGWAEATALVRPLFGGEVAWLAEYALLAVGRLQLGTLLGASAADAVVRAARQRGMLDRQVIKALEVLEGVFGTVKELELRPEHFFERPAKALLGATPRAYLTDRPLVRGESRLAVRDALREFVDAQAERNEQASAAGEASAPRETRNGAEEAATRSSTDAVPPGDQQLTGEPAGTEPAETEPTSAETGATPADVSTVGVPATEDPDAALRLEYEEREARLREEYERRLAEQRESADLRLAEERRAREQGLAEVREAADRRLAQEHQAAERRLAEERRAAEQRLAAVRAAAEERSEPGRTYCSRAWTRWFSGANRASAPRPNSASHSSRRSTTRRIRRYCTGLSRRRRPPGGRTAPRRGSTRWNGVCGSTARAPRPVSRTSYRNWRRPGRPAPNANAPPRRRARSTSRAPGYGPPSWRRGCARPRRPSPSRSCSSRRPGGAPRRPSGRRPGASPRASTTPGSGSPNCRRSSRTSTRSWPRHRRPPGAAAPCGTAGAAPDPRTHHAPTPSRRTPGTAWTPDRNSSPTCGGNSSVPSAATTRRSTHRPTGST